MQKKKHFKFDVKFRAHSDLGLQPATMPPCWNPYLTLTEHFNKVNVRMHQRNAQTQAREKNRNQSVVPLDVALERRTMTSIPEISARGCELSFRYESAPKRSGRQAGRQGGREMSAPRL